MGSSPTALACHPATPCRHVRAISVRVQRAPGGSISLIYVLDGAVDCLRLPSPGPVRRSERLWERTCFEAFIGPQDAAAYCEFNFSPSREWAAYAFRCYRDGGALALDWQPAIAVRRAADGLVLEATIRLEGLPAMLPAAPLRLGLAAVIEDEQGARSYWALGHTRSRPDFHDPAAFLLAIAPTPHACAEAQS